MKILILEDNKFILSIIQAALKVYDSQTHLASDQYQAEEMFNELQPEIVISDLHMDEGTSWDFLSKVKQSGCSKVLVVSSDYELLTKVEEELGLEGWKFVNKNFRKWLLQINEAVKDFFRAEKAMNL
ncbi:MAG: response regulator [Flavobacteriales bacterium]|nr:response regulator [Flavobacteriales bacterium]